jgi:hypothetical protein
VNVQDTSAEPTPDLQLEIAHILLMDLVGYSKLLVNEQIELPQELKQIVRSTECFRAAEARGRTHPGADRRWDGAHLLPQSGRTGAVCGGDQPHSRTTRACKFGWAFTVDRSVVW